MVHFNSKMWRYSYEKKVAKCIGLLIFIALIAFAIYSTYNWIVRGKQNIKISKPSKAYTNSDMYVSIIAQEDNVDLDTKTEIKLLDSKGHKVKNVNIKYEDNNAILSIPDIESGSYFLEAKVSSKKGKDTVKDEVYISKGNLENVTITFDKGIYKPGDTVNYRALITSKENDVPISKDINVSIYDGNDNKVYNENVKSSDYGIISGSFTLANEVNSGLYKLVVNSKENQFTKNFKVNPYVTPKYEVKINYDKENYTVGEKANITFNVKYFFGEPVKNSNCTVYIDNKKYTNLKTNDQGIATLSYEIKDAKTYNVKAEVVDSSNYFVEKISSFTAVTDKFEIQLLPEYENLVEGKKNDVYVFTSSADGTPIKTYITISSDNYTKQVATDENGIGKFSIDVDRASKSNDNYTKYYGNSNNKKQFNIVAEDTKGNKVSKNINLKIEQKDLLVSTNKVKYEQGEDININISSTSENSKNIYFFKNDKIIKMISTKSDETSINLDDTYGIIDIYVTDRKGTSKYYTNSYNTTYNTNYYKKTIFIKPKKSLSINVSTDKDEYKPGDKISILFDAVDENKTGVDAALLVSMLDNATLDLASNDLSIDNIKLALQNIKFSDDLDAATLYSCIVNDKSEQSIMALLLKQSDRDISVSEKVMNNRDEEFMSASISICSIVVILCIIIIFFCIKFKKFRNIMKHVINFLMFDLLIVLIEYLIMIVGYYIYDYPWWAFVITTIVGLAIYILLLSKHINKINRTSISLIILCVLGTLMKILINYSSISIIVVGIILSVILLVLVILSKIKKIKNEKIKKLLKFTSKEIIYILKFLCAVILSTIIGSILENIVGEIGILVAIVCIYVFNYLFNISKKEKNNSNIKKESNSILIIVAFIGILVIGYYGVMFVGSILKPTDIVVNNYTNSGFSGITIDGASGEGTFSSFATDTTNTTKGNTLYKIENLFSKNNSESNVEERKNNTNDEQLENIKDENVRNVFLESMCFIPELVTTNGKASLNLNLSDNITTWTIQTVGNTKDGRIGYGIISNVKVFKEFFVDFELPKNLVQTDKVSIPVTVYNYTDNQINTVIKIKEDDWFKLEDNNINVNVDAKSTNMVYVPISVLKSGNNKFRAEVSSNQLTDIVEKECVVSPKGYKVEKVVSTGRLDKDISEDILVLEDTVENTAKAKVKIYAGTMSQIVEGMENIFKMPTGCFEQVSSSLYPNILALKYLEDNGIVNEEIKQKALSYISSGYQKLLTYEVKGESGGYSLYGHAPSETVLTAYGLMEMSDLSKVYNVDESVIKKMTEYLYGKQNENGSFEITQKYSGELKSERSLALNAYITWALSESNPNDEKLAKSVKYLKGKLNDIKDNYTLALVANVLANVKDKELNTVLKRLVSNINLDNNRAYITSNVVDYYGSYSNSQTDQTVALTSMALSKGQYNPETNKLLINYLISKKDKNGTWNTTQATILALKALNTINELNKLENQTITVKVNSSIQKIDIKDNPLGIYELNFDNLNKENKLNIDIEKGNAYYEVVEEYYIPYEKVNTQDDKIEVSVNSNNDLKVNEILKANVKVTNKSDNIISNGMVTISIPQGFTVLEESLMKLESKGIIEKYEISYTSVNIYLRNIDVSQIVNLPVSFRAGYPVEITGMAVRAYDYYNPYIEGKTAPVKITVK